MPLNVEIKARCKDLEHLHGILMKSGADFKGTDLQEDRYYAAKAGRLKLRQGPIENTLIHYHRPETDGTKTSEVLLYHPTNPKGLQAVLDEAMALRVVVAKERRIYFHGNIKFHLDRVRELGSFVEIEAIDRDGSRTREDLEVQCQAWMTRLGIKAEDGIAQSYSDMLLAKTEA